MKDRFRLTGWGKSSIGTTPLGREALPTMPHQQTSLGVTKQKKPTQKQRKKERSGTADREKNGRETELFRKTGPITLDRMDMWPQLRLLR